MEGEETTGIIEEKAVSEIVKELIKAYSYKMRSYYCKLSFEITTEIRNIDFFLGSLGIYEGPIRKIIDDVAKGNGLIAVESNKIMDGKFLLGAKVAFYKNINYQIDDTKEEIEIENYEEIEETIKILCNGVEELYKRFAK